MFYRFYSKISPYQIRQLSFNCKTNSHHMLDVQTFSDYEYNRSVDMQKYSLSRPIVSDLRQFNIENVTEQKWEM